jgi:hypothetical protein
MTDEWRTENDIEGSCCVVTEGVTPSFVWGGGDRVRIARVPVEIRSERHPNTSLELYRYTDISGSITRILPSP